MPFGPFALQWTTPVPNPPTPIPLPSGITRSFISIPSGPLELLTALPTTSSSGDKSKPPIFFAHGGFGCAVVWLEYMQFFASHGYACYAISYRGHGGSWYPSLFQLYFSTLGTMAQDLVAGIHAAEEQETTRRNAPEKVRVILIAHSAGGTLSQYALSRSLVTVHGFCMAAAIPAFGSASVYSFWSLSAPFHFPYRLFHPRYILASTAQIHAAFFSPSTPVPVVRRLEKLLSPYESMLWPLQTMFRFVTGPDVLSSITARATGVTPRILVLAAEKDVLCRPDILLHAAQRYRAAFRELVLRGKVDGVSEAEISGKGDVEQGVYRDGVGYKVVKGLGHHLQNHEGWESGAEEILEWVERI